MFYSAIIATYAEIIRLVIDNHESCYLGMAKSSESPWFYAYKLTLYAFPDPRSNKHSIVDRNWTKNYLEVDFWYFLSCVHHSDSSLSADVTAALHGGHNSSYLNSSW